MLRCSHSFALTHCEDLYGWTITKLLSRPIYDVSLLPMRSLLYPSNAAKEGLLPDARRCVVSHHSVPGDYIADQL